METNEVQVSRNIKSMLKKYGYTQQTIADKMSITKRTYIKIENHPFNYTIDKLNLLAKKIGCNINDFFVQIQFTDSEQNSEDGEIK